MSECLRVDKRGDWRGGSMLGVKTLFVSHGDSGVAWQTTEKQKSQWHWWYMNKWTHEYRCKYLLGKMSVSMFTQTNTWKCRLDYYPMPQEEKTQVKRRKNTFQHRGNICLSTAKSKANVGAVINVKTLYGWRCSFPNWHWYQGATSDILRTSMPASI